MKIRNAFTNNMSNDVKVGKAQLSTTIQSYGLLGKIKKSKTRESKNKESKIAKEALLNLAVPLAKDI